MNVPCVTEQKVPNIQETREIHYKGRLGLGSNSMQERSRMWNRAGARPPNTGDLGPDVWNPDGIKILGTPVGNDGFVCAASTAHIEEESVLWERIGWVPDVQCAWQILLQCAGLRCHHWLRTVPPRQSAPFAANQDSGMWQAVATVLGRMPGNTIQHETAHGIATLPMRLGGLGLRSATSMAPERSGHLGQMLFPCCHSDCQH